MYFFKIPAGKKCRSHACQEFVGIYMSHLLSVEYKQVGKAFPLAESR